MEALKHGPAAERVSAADLVREIDHTMRIGWGFGIEHYMNRTISLEDLFNDNSIIEIVCEKANVLLMTTDQCALILLSVAFLEDQGVCVTHEGDPPHRDKNDIYLPMDRAGLKKAFGKLLVVLAGNHGPWLSHNTLKLKSGGMNLYSKTCRLDDSLLDAYREDFEFDGLLDDERATGAQAFGAWLDSEDHAIAGERPTASRFYSWSSKFQRFDSQWTKVFVHSKWTLMHMNVWKEPGEPEEQPPADAPRPLMDGDLVGKPMAEVVKDAEKLVASSLASHEPSSGQVVGVDMPDKDLAQLRAECKNTFHVGTVLLSSKRLHIDCRQLNDLFQIYNASYGKDIELHKTPEGVVQFRAKRSNWEWTSLCYDLMEVLSDDKKLRRYGITTGIHMMMLGDHVPRDVFDGEVEIAEQSAKLFLEAVAQRGSSMAEYCLGWPGAFSGLRDDRNNSRIACASRLETSWLAVTALRDIRDDSTCANAKAVATQLLKETAASFNQYTLRTVAHLLAADWNPNHPGVQTWLKAQTDGRAGTLQVNENLFRAIRAREKLTQNKNMVTPRGKCVFRN